MTVCQWVMLLALAAMRSMVAAALHHLLFLNLLQALVMVCAQAATS